MAVLRRIPGIAIVVLTWWCVACVTPVEQSTNRMMAVSDSLFACTLEVSTSIVAGNPVNVQFSLRNLSENPFYVLNWYTPLEGLGGKIFRLTKDGEEIPYRGMMVKRGDPDREDYVTLEPGAEISAEVDLSMSYDLTAPGAYHLAFTSRLNDVAREERSIPKKRDDHRPMALECTTLTFTITRVDG